MASPEKLYPALATIAAAGIAAIVASISLLLAKENKVSEFRQAWIDALRNDLSEYHGLVMHIVGFVRLKQKESNEEAQKFLEDNQELLLKLNTVQTRIRFRLNPKESEVMLNLLAYAENSHGFKTLFDPAFLAKYTNQFNEASTSLLKKEWERVKNGEKLYRVFKWSSLSVTGLFLVVVIFAILKYLLCT